MSRDARISRTQCTHFAAQPRWIHGFVCLLLLVTLGTAAPLRAASFRTQNFIVSAPTAEYAQQVAHHAEQCRRDLAVEWLGGELRPWHQPCPVTVEVGPQVKASGETSFYFVQGHPSFERMIVRGTHASILHSVLPHEVNHTVFATYFGRPLPRWADEGACTTVEHDSERIKHERALRAYMTADPPRSIPFNRMVRMTEYPRDILPLYAQGYSVVRYLVQRNGKQQFVQFLGNGMQTNNWDAAINSHYGFRDLSDLQVQWVEWIRQGSPDLLAASDGQPAASRPALEDISESAPPSSGTSPGVFRGQSPTKRSLFGFDLTDSWYARQRDKQPADEDEKSRKLLPSVRQPAENNGTDKALPARPEAVAPTAPTPWTPSPAGEPSRPTIASGDSARPPHARPRPLGIASPLPASTLRRKSAAPSTDPPPPIYLDAPSAHATTFWR